MHLRQSKGSAYKREDQNKRVKQKCNEHSIENATTFCFRKGKEKQRLIAE